MSRRTKPTDLGSNRTGAASAPARAKEMEEGVARHGPPAGAGRALATTRAAAASEAPPVGTVPVPTTLRGAAKTVAQALKGDKASVFVDRLGQRLAFERSGVRLYDAVLAKVPAAATGKGTLTAAELRRHRDEELKHLHLVWQALDQLGADPTAVTPGADIVGVEGLGLVQTVCDPRTTLTQCLDALLVAELADNDGWKLLIAMSEALGQADLAAHFTDALAEEDEHLASVRRWLAERLEVELGAKLPSLEFGEPSQPAS
jgi:Ferritin-like domain